VKALTIAINNQPQAYFGGVYHYRIRPLDGGRGMVSGEFVVLK